MFLYLFVKRQIQRLLCLFSQMRGCSESVQCIVFNCFQFSQIFIATVVFMNKEQFLFFYVGIYLVDWCNAM